MRQMTSSPRTIATLESETDPVVPGGTPPPVDRGVRMLRVGLGVIWLLDGALQLQPTMFTRGFVSGVLVPSAQGESGFIARPTLSVANLIAPHVAVWNGLFAATQLAIGFGILAAVLARRVGFLRLALAGSIVWSAMVWWLGEGLGGVLAGASPLSGAPGAVVLYLVAALLLWPGRAGEAPAPLLGGRLARGTWLVLWAVSAFLLLEPTNQGKGAVSAVVATAASGEPGFVHRLLGSVAAWLQGTGPWLDSALALAMLVIGIGVALRRAPRFLLGVSLVLSAAIWVFGEGFGGMLTGQGTDPNSGPLWALLALCMWVGLWPSTPSAGALEGRHVDVPDLAGPALSQIRA